MSFRISIQQPDTAPSPSGKSAPSPAGGVMGSAPGAPVQTTVSVDSGSKKKEEKPAGCAGGGMMQFGLIAVFFVFIYFVMIRPQQKRQKEHQSMLNALIKGDKVITSGGLLGTIVSLTDRYAVVEISTNTRVRILRSHISGKQAIGNTEESDTAQGNQAPSGRKKSKKNKKDNA